MMARRRPGFLRGGGAGERLTRSDRSRLVCVSGLDGAAGEWTSVTASLARHGNVIAVELTLRTPSGGPGRHDPLQAAAEALGRVLADLPRRSVLIGHSMGGIVSMVTAARQPGWVSGLVLTAPFLPFSRNGRSTLLSAADYARHRALFIADGRGRRRDRREHQARDRRTQAAALRTLARYGVRPAAFHNLADRVSCPVLLLHGDEDHYVPPAFALAAADRHPQWEFSLIPGAGHFPHRDNPANWLASVDPWLRRLQPG
jgi:pimeloyl-ACP methyl ester carboxylesterase